MSGRTVTRSSVKVDEEKIQVDPQLLFQCLTVATQSERVDDMGVLFQYELYSYPKSLFDASLMLLKQQKSAMADGIWAKLPSVPTEPKVHLMAGHSFIGSVATRISYI